MNNWLARLFAPSVFKGIDPERTSQLLRFVFRLTIVISAISMILNAIIAFNQIRLMPMVVAIFVSWGCNTLLARGNLRLAGVFYFLFLWAMVLAICLWSGGITSPVFGIYAAVVFFAGVIFGAFGGYAFTALAVLTGLGLMGLEASRQLPQALVNFRPIDTLIVNGVVYASLLALLFALMRNIHDALGQAQQEVSDRRQAETAFRQLERRYQAVVERTNDAVILMDFDSTILDVNQRCEEMFGRTRAEMVGQRGLEFVASEERQEGLDSLSRVLKGQRLPLYERKMLRADGQEFCVEVNLSLVYDENGVPIQAQSILRDITERKKAEAKLKYEEAQLRRLVHQSELQSIKIQTALEVSKAAISILEPEILIQKIVDLVKARFGYYYVGLFLLSDDQNFAELRAGTGEEGRKLIQKGHSLTIGSGSMIGWSIANKQPRVALDVGLDADHYNNPLLPNTRSEMTLPLLVRDKVIGAVTIQSDVEEAFGDEEIAVLQVVADLVAIAIDNARLHVQITGYTEELEGKVKERTAQLQTTNRELEAFSYTISHDLRTPIRAIHGFSSILLEEYQDELPPVARSFQEKIRDNATKMANLVDGLLSFSRLGKKKIQKSEVDPRALVQEILEDFGVENLSRTIEITIGNLPACQADPILLQQVFTNLISNAIKFTQNREVARIEISSLDTISGLAYFVRDNGVGFEMQYIDQLFRVFQRLHRDEEFEGTGVGLANVRRIIHRHGGEVWAEAEVGKGATFFFTLGDIAIDESGIFYP